MAVVLKLLFFISLIFYNKLFFISFFLSILEIVMLKIFFFNIYFLYLLILLLPFFCIIYVLNIDKIYLRNYLTKLDKLKNFSLISSSLIFIYIYLIYIVFYFKNAYVSYMYTWVLFHKEFIYSFDVILGVDILTIFFLLLTSMIFPLIFYYITFFKRNFSNVKDYNSYPDIFLLLFIIYLFLILTFLSLNFFFFFFFFESSLIFLFLLINLGGSKKKKYYASYSLFFFTAFGSILILTAILLLFINYKTLNIQILMNEEMDINFQKILTLLLFFGFAVKIPVLPFYNWLPEAHVEASAIGSVLLASILLKVGAYGILRFMLPILKEGIFFFFNFFTVFCLLSIIISSFLALLQSDLKKIIAYSSITHMNYITLGLLNCELNSIIGAVFYMVSHAFVSAALFFIIGIIYENLGSRELLHLNNLNFYNPFLSFFFFFFNFANIAFPLTSSFISELLIFSGFIKINVFLTLILISCLFLSSLYTLWILHNIVFNKIFSKQKNLTIQLKDILILFFFFFMILLFGIFPTIYLSNIELSLIFYLKFNYIL